MDDYECMTCGFKGYHRHVLVHSRCHACHSIYIVPLAVFGSPRPGGPSKPNKPSALPTKPAQVVKLRKAKPHLRLIPLTESEDSQEESNPKVKKGEK